MSDERGQSSVELLLMLPLLFLVGLCVWQMHLVMTFANDAENAARTAARQGGGPGAVADALPPERRDDVVRCGQDDGGDCTTVSGRRVHVVLRVPVVAPVGHWGFHVRADAVMPDGIGGGP